MTPAPHSPLETVEQFLSARAIRANAAPLLAAVSGGADSIALLHLLLQAGFQVVVAHFDHQTRSGASLDDAEWVREHCRALNVHCEVGTGAVARDARQSGRSFEEEARAQRYAHFDCVARARCCAAIVTGHTWDDSVETILMRVIRGAGTAGLGGIPAQGARNGLLLLRPLLALRREALRDWLREQGLSWREDESNASPEFLRNRVRHALLPLLRRDYNPSVEEALSRMAAIMRLDQEALERWLDAVEPGVREHFTVKREAFRRLLPALQHRLMLRLAHALAFEPGMEQVARAVAFVETAPTGKFLAWGNGNVLYAGRGEVRVLPEAVDTAQELKLDVPGEASFGRHHLIASVLALPAPPWREHCTAFRQLFDRDKLSLPLQVRTRRPGDRFRPLGMEGSRKLSDYLIDRGVPAPLRAGIPLVVTGDEIVWVVGHAPGQVAALDSSTKHCICLEVVDATQ